MKAHRETLGHWLLQRTTAAFSVPTILIANVSTLILLNILLFRHIHVGIEEILADHVHHEVTRNWILILLRIFLLVIIKDVFVLFVCTSGALSIIKAYAHKAALIRPSILVQPFHSFSAGYYLSSTYSRFILTKAVVSRVGHKFSETTPAALKRSFSTGGPIQPAMLARMKTLIWKIWNYLTLHWVSILQVLIRCFCIQDFTPLSRFLLRQFTPAVMTALVYAATNGTPIAFCIGEGDEKGKRKSLDLFEFFDANKKRRDGNTEEANAGPSSHPRTDDDPESGDAVNAVISDGAFLITGILPDAESEELKTKISNFLHSLNPGISHNVKCHEVQEDFCAYTTLVDPVESTVRGDEEPTVRAIIGITENCLEDAKTIRGKILDRVDDIHSPASSSSSEEGNASSGSDSDENKAA